MSKALCVTPPGTNSPRNAPSPTSQTELPKPTEGMEYTYARKSAANNIDRKDIAHIWEVAGSDELCEEVTNSENLFLGMRQVSTRHSPPGARGAQSGKVLRRRKLFCKEASEELLQGDKRAGRA